VKKNGTEIYSLAVCFVAVICVSVTSVIVIYNAIGAMVPRFTIQPWQISSYESDAAYTRHWATEKPIPSAHELASMREAELQQAIQGERRSSIQNLTIGLIVILHSLVLNP
jgi:hypothetical protein